MLLEVSKSTKDLGAKNSATNGQYWPMVNCLCWANCKSSIEFQDLKEWRACFQVYVPHPPGFFLWLVVWSQWGWENHQLQSPISHKLRDQAVWIAMAGKVRPVRKQKSGGRNRASIAVMKMLDLDPRKNPPDPVKSYLGLQKLTCEPPSHPISWLFAAYDIGQFGRHFAISSCLAPICGKVSGWCPVPYF